MSGPPDGVDRVPRETRLATCDPVDDLVPEMADMTVIVNPNGPLENTVPAARSITVRDLLGYTLGTGMAVGRRRGVQQFSAPQFRLDFQTAAYQALDD
jgi:hypothetical protein